jgi:hypothetical protein
VKQRILTLALISICACGFSKKFTDAPAGQGEATVGTSGADYSSMAAAAADFNTLSSGLTGDTTLTITTDLTESNNLAFGAPTNGFSFTIKPANSTATDPVVVNLTSNAAIAGDYPNYGHIKFGTNDVNGTFDNLTTMPNILVDGSRGTTGKHLKFAVPASVTTNTGVLRFLGECDNATVRNCIIENLGGTVGTSTFNFGIVFSGHRTTSGSNMVTQNLRIENNDILTSGGADGRAILTQFIPNAGHGITAGVAHTGVITSNTIQSNRNCVNLQNFADGTVSKNKLSIYQTLTGRPTTMDHQSCNLATGWTMNVLQNDFSPNVWVNTDGHLGAMSLGMTPANGSGTYNIINNMISGYNYTGVAQTGTSICRGITANGSGSTCNYNIYHNSISIANQPNQQQTAAAFERYAAVSIHDTNYAGTFNLRNNIIRNEHAKGVVLYRNTFTAGTYNSDNNTFYYGSTGKMANYGQANGSASANYLTLSAWQTGTSKDLASNELNPFAPGVGGKWISDTNLHFDATPNGSLFNGASGLGVTSDIDDQARSTIPTKGADELAGNSTAAQLWNLY